MKLWRCEKCRRERESDADIIIKICYVCQEEMKEVENGRQRKG